MNKKYILLENDTITHNDSTLYRIKAIRDFSNVKNGDFGGYIEKEENLSHDDSCWISGNAQVFGNAKVYDNAQVFNNAKVYENASVYGDAQVYGNARVFENAYIFGNAQVFDNVHIFGNTHIFGNGYVRHNAQVSGNTEVSGNAKVYGDANVFGDTCVCGKAIVCGETKIDKTENLLVIGPIGSRNDFTTFAKSNNKAVYVTCGCFHDTIDEFEKKVLKTYTEDVIYRKQYISIIECVKTLFN